MSSEAVSSEAVSSKATAASKTKPTHHRSWQKTSVRQFLGQINWEHDPEPVQRVKQLSLEGRSESLSLTLSVDQFFTCIDWEGQGAIAPSTPPPPEENVGISATEEDVTLDDFSSLF